MADDASRRHQRIPVDVPVHVASIDGEVDPETGRRSWRSSEERCRNLSAGGALIRTVDPPATGQRLLLRIHVGGEETIERTGRVAWSRRVIDSAAGAEHGVGVVFEEGAAGGAGDPGMERLLAGGPASDEGSGGD